MPKGSCGRVATNEAGGGDGDTHRHSPTPVNASPSHRRASAVEDGLSLASWSKQYNRTKSGSSCTMNSTTPPARSQLVSHLSVFRNPAL